MTQEVFVQILRDLPTTAIVLLVLFVGSRYLGRGFSAFAAQTEAAAEQRQSQILVILQQLVVARDDADKRLIEVIERNSRAIDHTGQVLVKASETLAAVQASQVGMIGQLQTLSQVMIEHERDVAARPCQMESPSRRTPRKVGAGE